MSISLSDNEFWVQSGSFPVGRYSLIDEKFTNGEIAIKISKLVSCAIVKDEHTTSQSGAGRIAGGILGAALLGPIGALGGLLAGGKKRVDQTVILCGFDDNRTFTAESTQLGAANLVRIAQLNISLGKNQSLVANSSPVVEGDQMECPQCAEIIKRKAKICRYCGFVLENASIPPDSTKGHVDVDSGVGANHPFQRFLTDYRAQVKDSPFSSDSEVISAVNRFSELYAKSDQSVFLEQPQMQLAKELGVLVSDIEKMFDSYSTVKFCVDRYNKNETPGGLRGGLTDAQILQVISAISDVRLSNPSMFYDFEINKDTILKLSEFEMDAVRKVLSDTSEVVFRQGQIKAVLDTLVRHPPLCPFYLINDFILSFNPATRKKKKRQIQIKGANSRVSDLLKSPEFNEWYERYFDENIKVQNVVRLYCGLLELEKFFADLNADEDFYSGFCDSLSLGCSYVDGPDSNNPDRWASKNYKEEIRTWNETFETKVDDDVLIAKFELGFNGVL